MAPPADPKELAELDAIQRRLEEGLKERKQQFDSDESPTASRREGLLLARIADLLDEKRHADEAARREAYAKAERDLAKLRRPSIEQGPAPEQKQHPANLEWLKYVIPPVAAAVAAIVGANYIKKEDFDRELNAQRESIASLNEKLEDERKERLRLQRCLDKHGEQTRRFQVVSVAGLGKLGIVIRGQTEEVQKVKWKSEAMGDPNTGKLPTWSPIDIDQNEIQVKPVTCGD